MVRASLAAVAALLVTGCAGAPTCFANSTGPNVHLDIRSAPQSTTVYRVDGIEGGGAARSGSVELGPSLCFGVGCSADIPQGTEIAIHAGDEWLGPYKLPAVTRATIDVESERKAHKLATNLAIASAFVSGAGGIFMVSAADQKLSNAAFSAGVVTAGVGVVALVGAYALRESAPKVTAGPILPALSASAFPVADVAPSASAAASVAPRVPAVVPVSAPVASTPATLTLPRVPAGRAPARRFPRPPEPAALSPESSSFGDRK